MLLHTEELLFYLALMIFQIQSLSNESLLYAAYLDGDARVIQMINRFLFTSPAYTDEIKEIGHTIYSEILNKREEMGIQMNIGSDEFLEDWAKEQECPTESDISLSEMQCNPFVY
ncbi:hypothetical protein [Alteromonas sp. 14N.309.X.WAT.G.H12]|uniref:hypothetical protein n=1 Tax=Alteromonas sp. 14N.309.X.WAT.G.H12 TaxID=3120824 RepID=UPI002FCEF1AC